MCRAVKNSLSHTDEIISRFTRDFETLRRNLETGLAISMAEMSQNGISQIQLSLDNLKESVDDQKINGKLACQTNGRLQTHENKLGAIDR